LLPARAIAVLPPVPATSTTLIGKGWHYTVPFAVKNTADIEKLIQCESQGVNISRPDSDGIFSDGILQFHRGHKDTLVGGTWEAFSASSGITGSPIWPNDAIKMTDWAISHGLLSHWSCAKIEHLL
jgi:hypothetical protein